MKNLYLTNRFFWLFGALVVLFVISFWAPLLFPVAQGIFVLALALVLLDVVLLFNRRVELHAERQLPRIFNLADANAVKLEVENRSQLPLAMTLIDELPPQFQIRDFEKHLYLKPGELQLISYELRPMERGA